MMIYDDVSIKKGFFPIENRGVLTPPIALASGRGVRPVTTVFEPSWFHHTSAPHVGR
jgi:hypothetical protein